MKQLRTSLPFLHLVSNLKPLRTGLVHFGVLSLSTYRLITYKPWKPCMIICNKCKTGTWTWALGGQTGTPLQNRAWEYLLPALWLIECLKLVLFGYPEIGLPGSRRAHA